MEIKLQRQETDGRLITPELAGTGQPPSVLILSSPNLILADVEYKSLSPVGKMEGWRNYGIYLLAAVARDLSH